MAMNDKEFEIIQEAKRTMEQSGVQGVQFMKFEEGVAVFEAFGKAGEPEYVNYTLDVQEAIETEEFIFQKQNVTIENYSEEKEIDITVNTWKFDDAMNEISFSDKLVKTYKRYSSASKKAHDVASGLVGANLVIIHM